MIPALDVADLVVTYGKVQALHGVSLRVGQGETVALVGRNGAGKTTLLRAAFGFVRPASGAVRFEGREITGRPAHRMPSIGIAYVPESRDVFKRLSVLENLRLGALRSARSESDGLAQVFSLFPALEGRSRASAGTLSGGQQQMLALGRALMSGPRLLLLDEPSLGLAPKVLDSLFASLGELSESGMSILLVEQNVRRALAIASRGYLLNLGRVVLEASAADILADDRLQSVYLGRSAEMLSGETR